MQRRKFKYKNREFKEARKQKKQSRSPSEHLECTLNDHGIYYKKNYELLIRKGRETYDYYLPDYRLIIELSLLSDIFVKVKGVNNDRLCNVIAALNQCQVLRFDNEEIFDIDIIRTINYLKGIDKVGPVRDEISFI